MNAPYRLELSEVLAILRLDPMGNVVLLKTLNARSSGIDILHCRTGVRQAVLLRVEGDAFDRETYREAQASVLLSSDDAEPTRTLLRQLPRHARYVFKLSRERDRAVVAESFSLERQRAFHSYTSDRTVSPGCDTVDVSCDPRPELLPLLAEQGHRDDWLAPLLAKGRAFTCSIAEEGRPLSACLVFRIDDAFWEIGGVYTVPDARRRGLAQRVVGRALAELHRLGRRPRYQVAETNQASIRLAEALGMKRFLTLTHFVGEAL